MWIGLTIAYAAPSVPPSFGILAVATGAYIVAFLATVGWRHLQSAAGPARRTFRLARSEADPT